MAIGQHLQQGIKTDASCDATSFHLDGVAYGAQRTWDGLTTGTGAWVAEHGMPRFVTTVPLSGTMRVFVTQNGSSNGAVLFSTSSIPFIQTSIRLDDAVSGVSTAAMCWAVPASFATTSTSYITLYAALVSTSVANLAASGDIDVVIMGNAAS